MRTDIIPKIGSLSFFISKLIKDISKTYHSYATIK